MGSWRNRPPRRRKYDPNRYLYQEGAHPSYHDQSTPDNVPSWEKRFCRLVGTIPWGKIVYSKTLLNYHDNIFHWNDSAAEEAFQNAKKRFWAEINGLPCDISLPDPDIFVDEINWNQAIDPKLIEDIDKQYFNPDDVEEGEQMGSKIKRTGNLVGSLSDRCNVNPENSENSWEINNLHHGEDVKNLAWSTNSWDNEIREPGRQRSDDNPWEQGYCQGNRVRKENVWDDGVKLSGWNQGAGDSNRQNSGNSENNGKWAKTALNWSDWNAEKSRKWGSNPDAMDYGYIGEDRASNGRWRLGLMRRMPPKHTETALSALLSLLPRHSSDLLSQVDQPLQVLCDIDGGKEFILCEYNRDADSYRSPWSSKYHPPLEDGTQPSPELRKLEIEANEIFAIYRDQYYEGGISSVYMWEDDNEGFVACFLIKKDGSKTAHGRRGYLEEGAWDAIHVIEVGPEEDGTAHYCLTSTVMLSLTTDDESSGTFSLSGSIRRQMNMDLSVAEGHLCNMGRMIEEMESKMRNSLDQVYFGKTKEMVCTLRPPAEVTQMRMPES